MLATAIIVFREVLEAALIVGIVLAASQGVRRRSLWVGGGVLGGILGAVVVAGFAESLAAAMAGVGQEIFNAGILFAAVAMLGWHNIWMRRHGSQLAGAANRLGAAVRSGAQPLWALGFAVGLAVLREGSEVVLFLYGIAAAGEDSTGAMAMGGALGLAAGVAAGTGIYLGLVRIPMRHLFAVTGWLILLLAAGMASQGAAFLAQADLLPPLGSNLWDTSFLLSDQSLAGRVMHTLVGYTARPAGIQLVFYLATLLIIGTLMRLVGGAPKTATSAPRRPHLPDPHPGLQPGE
ncbi:MAG: FTR1 family protein [Alphaproteobacteria bacterium]|nr:FTR1 family protein [Alphaproteobacteria bacterium]